MVYKRAVSGSLVASVSKALNHRDGHGPRTLHSWRERHPR